MKMKISRIVKLTVTLGIVAALFGARSASAATATASLSVTATVTNNCTISTSALAFGSYDPVVANASSPLDGTGSVTIACTKGAATTVGLNLGSNASGSVRRMNASTNYLTYEMYQDSGRATVWGNSGAALLNTGTSPGMAARSFTVYGRVSAAQDIPAASYSDTVTATVNF